MHSIYSRINNASAFLSSCLMALLAAVALSSYVLPSTPGTSQVAVGTIKVYVLHFFASSLT
jgi:signal peptidase complex subunit 3